MVVKTKQFSLISVVSQKRMVVKTKQFSLLVWLVKKNMVVKTKEYLVEFGWLVRKAWWLKQNSFRYLCG